MSLLRLKFQGRPPTTLCWIWTIYCLVSGCITPEVSEESADLIAVPYGSFSGPDAYCNFTNEPKLFIVIQNQGQGDAPSTMTRVSFSPGGSFEITTPPVRAGQRSVLAPVVIPPACFDPDCDFKVTVDAKSDVNEDGGEENNVVDGRCMRP